jgi:large-conductance mechanosensitive channel
MDYTITMDNKIRYFTIHAITYDVSLENIMNILIVTFFIFIYILTGTFISISRP